MIVKLENSEININGRSVIRGLICLQIGIGLCRAIYKAEKKYSAALKEELKMIKKEQKISKKKQKAESK